MADTVTWTSVEAHALATLIEYRPHVIDVADDPTPDITARAIGRYNRQVNDTAEALGMFRENSHKLAAFRRVAWYGDDQHTRAVGR